MEGQRNIVESSIRLATSPIYSRGEYRTLETEGKCLDFAPDSPPPPLGTDSNPYNSLWNFPPFLNDKIAYPK